MALISKIMLIGKGGTKGISLKLFDSKFNILLSLSNKFH